MDGSRAFVTQSTFFSPAFNSAIFDGPMRIYFAQNQEPAALKLYSHLQTRFIESAHPLRRDLRQKRISIFILLYPTTDEFAQFFGQASSQNEVEIKRMGHDYVLGVNPRTSELSIACIADGIEEIAISELTEQERNEPELLLGL